VADREPVSPKNADAFPIGATVTLDQLEHDPHPILASLRKDEPVSWLPALDGWLVTRHDLAVAVMRDASTFTVDDPRFSTGLLVGPSMLSLDGEDHARHRAPFATPFRPTAVKERFAQPAADQANHLIDGFADQGRAELRREFAGPLAASIMARALGLDQDEVTPMLGWYDGIVAAVTDITAGQDVPAAGRDAFAALRTRLTDVIADDTKLLGAAATHSDLTHDQVISNAAILLFGGIETTEGMITNALLYLLENPPAAAEPEPTNLDAVIDESLRLEPAAAVVDRYATTDTTLADTSIDEGDLVRVSVAAANRDPAIFEHPDQYIPGRPRARRHLAFAQGPHVCLGIHLARLEARAGLTALTSRLPNLRLDPDHPSRVKGLVFRKPPTLHARWEPD
jgi:cytochrome P450